jgi:hypothetical protein
MNKLLLKLAITDAAGSLLSSHPMAAQVSPTTPRTARVLITEGRQLELSKEHLTIIRWTTNDPGDSPVPGGPMARTMGRRALSSNSPTPLTAMKREDFKTTPAERQ